MSKAIVSIISGILLMCPFIGYGEEFPGDYAKGPRFRLLYYYDTEAEVAHVEFAEQTREFIHLLSYGEGFLYDVTTSLEAYPLDSLKKYDLIVMANALPKTPQERADFQRYMEDGGGWVGFHASGYNDSSTNWPWLNEFLGCGTFYCNTWPPQPALCQVDMKGHPVTKNLPAEFVAPACEWYQWNPPVTENRDVDVLVSLSQSNYPLGIKDIMSFGPFPIVWSNRNYRMIYLNIGHGDLEYTDATQNLLITNAIRWIALFPKRR
ncbi:MAG: ThuA domain-containing protein [Bacteroidales bacterium]|nr:ThuA domain-containing protein [Bacteroidales bacterium]